MADTKPAAMPAFNVEAGGKFLLRWAVRHPDSVGAWLGVMPGLAGAVHALVKDLAEDPELAADAAALFGGKK